MRKSGVRVEVAAFQERAGTDILLKSSGFIDLAVYYEGYLAAQNGEQGEKSVEEQYKKLIQSQESDLNGEQGEESMEEQYKDLVQSPERELNEDDVKVTVDLVGNETSVPVSDDIDELEL